MKSQTFLIILLSFCSHVLFSQSCLPEGIRFTTQSQIDAFAGEYPGCKIIEGRLEIASETISSLEGLSQLTSVSGDLEIIFCDELINLSGLDNITSVGGNLNIKFNQVLENCSGLESLDSVGGDLFILKNDAMISLEGLNSLTYIAGSLCINSNSALFSLEGLNSLQGIDSSLIVLYNTSLPDLSGLENLSMVSGQIEIVSNTSLSSLKGIDNIDAGSVTELFIHDNPILDSCSIQSICNYLISPSGSVNIYSNAAGCLNPPKIAERCGIALPCLPYGNYYFYHQAEIDSFQNDYTLCDFLNGNAIIEGDEIKNLNGLNGIRKVDGFLRIYSCDSLLNMTGFNNLDSVGGSLSIYGCNSLKNLSGFDNLEFIGGDKLSIMYIRSMVDLTGLNSLFSIEGDIEIQFADSLTSLAGLNNLNRVGGFFNIWDAHVLTNLEALENLSCIKKRLELGYNYMLTDLDGLDNLDTLGGLMLFWCSSLNNLEGLSNLTKLDGGLGIYFSYNLENLVGLENLDSIGGSIVLNQNPVLQNINGLNSVQKIAGNITIGSADYYGGNDMLTSLSGLDNIEPGSIMNLKVYENPLLSTCDVLSICNYLSSPNGTVVIQGNAPGCNSRGEVEAACGVGVEESAVGGQRSAVGGRQSAVVCYPNPASNQVTFDFHLQSSAEVKLMVFNGLGQLVATLSDGYQDKGDHQILWNTSEFPSGIYFYLVLEGNELFSGKIYIVK